MSVALDLWRALEAWDAGRHPRGPGGKFISLAAHSGGHDGHAGGRERPSLADAVRGTVAAGPKRQRGDKGGMSVGDAVRAAAKRSDTTGRPTQRTDAEHRAHGAHDVADEVDRALSEAGVSEDVRRQISGRARARADSHGPRPGGAPKTLPKALPKTVPHEAPHKAPAAPAAATDAESAIRRAHADLARMPGDWVTLAEIRDRIPEVPRADVDAALEKLAMKPGVQLIPWDNRKALTARDHDAALHFGGEDNHNLRIEDTMPPAPARREPPAAPASGPRMHKHLTDQQLQHGLSMHGNQSTLGKKLQAEVDHRKAHGPGAGSPKPPAAPARKPKQLEQEHLDQIAARLAAAGSHDQAREHLHGLTVPQLRQVAKHHGVHLLSSDTKGRALDRILNSVVGRRLDSAAISRITAR